MEAPADDPSDNPMNLLSVATLSTKRYGAKAFTSDEDEDFEEDELEDDDDEDDDAEVDVEVEDEYKESEGSSADEEEDEDDDSDRLPRLSLSSLSLITRVRQEEGSFFSLLPTELRLNIFSFLSPSQLAKIRLVSHQWRELAEDDRLWRTQHQSRLGGPLVLKYSKNPIRKQVERNKKKEMLLLRQEQRKRKKEWAEKRKLWARKEKARHKEREREREERREDREHAVRGFVASVIDHEKRRKCSAEAHVAPIIVVSSDEQPPAVIIEGVDVATGTRTPGSSEIAIREGVLEPTYEENGGAVVIKDKDKAKRVKDKVREIKDEIKTLEEDLQVLGIQEKQDETPNARWVEGYWAFGRYIKKIAHAAQMKENKEVQRKQEALKKTSDSKSPMLAAGVSASPPSLAMHPMPYPYGPTTIPVSPRVVAGEDMRLRQLKALEEKEKRKDRKDKKEKREKDKEKKEKRSRSLSETRKAQERKAADKIDVHGRLKRQRSRTTDDIEPAIREAKEMSRLDDLRKRSGLSRASPEGSGRQRSYTIDYEDHLVRQVQLARNKEKEKEREKEQERERKLKAKLEKERETAKRKETDLWAFWSGLSRSVQAWIMMTAASFGHRIFLERLYAKLKEDKTVGKLLVPIYHQLLHAACQQGQPEAAEFLLHMKLDFQTDRRVAHSPAFKHMEHQLQVARWDAFRTASKWGHTKLIEILLSHGYQPDERAVRGAIVGGQLEILKLLISFGADIKPIHMKRAIYYRNRDIVAHLLDLFPHLPQAEPYLLKIAVSTRANFRQTERMRNRTIPKFVDFGIIDLLLTHGADINDNSDIHYAPSPLHIAAQQGNPGLCEYLLEKGADMHGIFSCPPYAVSNPLLHKTRGLVLTLTPFEVAVYNGRERVVEYFLAKAASSSHPLTEISKLFCKPESKKQPRGANMFRVDLAYLREAMDGGAAGADAAKQTNARDKPKLTTILHQPEELDQVPNVKNIFKIFRAYRVNFREIESHVSAYLPSLSPLHHAAKNDNLSGILALLLETGLNREKRDKKGRTPLLKAARFCSTENIQVMLRYHVMSDAIDCEGNSAFHHLVTALPSVPSFLSSSAPLSTHAPVNPPRSPTKSRAALGHSLPMGSSPPSNVPSSSSSPSASSPQSASSSSSVMQDSSPAKVVSAIKMLIDCGADINMINNLDETCLDLLARKSKKYCAGKNDVALFLKAHGAKSGKELVQSVKSKSKLRGLLGL